MVYQMQVFIQGNFFMICKLIEHYNKEEKKMDKKQIDSIKANIKEFRKLAERIETEVRNWEEVIEISTPKSKKIISYRENTYFDDWKSIVNSLLKNPLEVLPTEVEMPYCNIIGMLAFKDCKNLTSINLPVCKCIGDGAFESCVNLTNIDSPECEIVHADAFYGCKNLTSIVLNKCKMVESSGFEACEKLVIVKLPLCWSIDFQTFEGCTSLKSVDLPICRSIGISAFEFCTNLIRIDLPMCTSVGTWAFNECSKLKEVHFAKENRGKIVGLSEACLGENQCIYDL